MSLFGYSGPFHGALADTVAVARENEITLKAGGIAYYLFNSLVPLLLFFLIVLSIIDGFASVTELFETLTGLSSARFTAVMESMIGEDAGRSGAAIIAGAILAWSSLTLVQAINVAFKGIYNVRSDRSLVETVLNSLLVFITIVLLVPIISLTVVVLTTMTDVLIIRVINVPLLFFALLAGLFPMYYHFPAR